MIWTVMPLGLVMEGIDSYQPRYSEIKRDNAILIVEEQGGNQAKIIRLISTDPAHYLDPAFQPGTMISLNEQKPRQPAAC